MNEAERRLDSILVVLDSLWTELGVSLSDGRVWISFVAALALGGLCALVGTWSARRVGLLGPDAPRGEILGVGISCGLLIIAASWAAVFSGGRSSFTPVAAAFVIALALTRRKPRDPDATIFRSSHDSTSPPIPKATSRASILPVVLAGAGFVVLVGLLYGATIAPSPRANVQPIEFFDTAYYSVLGADLARTGTESIYSPSGFAQLPGLPIQTWYHWGELWLAAAVISTFGIDPILARHYVVLPIVLLAAAALTGTLVRRLTGTSSRGAFVFGATAAVLLAPVPLPFPGPYLSKWANGLIFEITLYGLGTITALLSMYILAVRASLGRSWALSIFSGAAIASMLPAHILIASLALVGVVGVGSFHCAHSVVVKKRVLAVSAVWLKTLVALGVITVGTVTWGIMTGHGIGASALSESVTPFNDVWRQAVVRTAVGAGALFAIPVAWLLVRRKSAMEAWIAVGTMVILTTGAIVWGARLGDFNMFHAFFGGIAVFGTPAAAIAAWRLWGAAQGNGHLRLAAALFVVCGVQLGFGVANGIGRLQAFGPPAYQPIPLSVLGAIARLPADAKLAYSCSSLGEAAFWDPALVSIDAHTARRVVPMCFQAEFFTWMISPTDSSTDIANPLFRFAPQRTLYPYSHSRPSPSRVASFLKEHDVDYIYVDDAHPNYLVPDAIPIAESGGVEVLQIP